MSLFKWIGTALAITVGCSKMAQAIPLDSWPTWSVAQPYVSKQVPPGALIVRGSGTNAYYVLEANPTTGALPVDASIVIPPGSEIDVTNFPTTVDTNYGTVGASTLRSAAQIGNATGAAAFGAGSTSAQTLRVVLPTDQTTIPTTSGGGAYADSVRNVYSSTNVTTGTWVQLIASTAAVINCLTVFDSSGQTLELGIGAAMSESRVLIIPPGGLSGCIRLRIAAATRLSIRAISATAALGELDVTGIQ